MKLHLNTAGYIHLVRSYQAGQVVVAEQRYRRSLLLSPQRIIPDWRPLNFAELTANDVLTIAELEPEVVLLGTGQRLRFPAAPITRPLVERAVGLEVMDTAAACRTYNILASEGRRVVAALLLAD